MKITIKSITPLIMVQTAYNVYKRKYHVDVDFEDSVHQYNTSLQLFDEEISAANIIHLIKHIYQDEYKVQEKIDRLNKEIQELEP